MGEDGLDGMQGQGQAPGAGQQHQHQHQHQQQGKTCASILSRELIKERTVGRKAEVTQRDVERKCTENKIMGKTGHRNVVSSSLV
eukprot:757436-Hanusia_phi.AAC.4